MEHPSFPSYITCAYLDGVIERGLAEDIGPGDVTTLATVSAGHGAEARFLAKEEGVVAGLHVLERLFAEVDPSLLVTWSVEDGAPVEAGTAFGTVRGPARSLLTAERLALNILQRMSGIATMTRRMVAAVHPYKARLLDTRKTAPGLRLLDKWAVRLGGGENHRIGLYDMILIKDNHIAAAGGVREAVRRAVRYRLEHAPDVLIEVEAAQLGQIDVLLEIGGIDYILLDNMTRPAPNGAVDCSMLRAAVERVGGRIPTEASGNVTLDTVHAIAATGVDYISCGGLTHSVKALDISLKIALE